MACGRNVSTVYRDADEIESRESAGLQPETCAWRGVVVYNVLRVPTAVLSVERVVLKQLYI